MLQQSKTFFDENTTLDDYLAQYALTDFINWSDDSDFVDTTYETHMEHENYRIQAKEIRAKKKLEFDEFRQNLALTYYRKHIRDPKSIFKLTGLAFEHYNHRLISCIFSPGVLNLRYICAHRNYHIKLKFRRRYWVLKRNHTPNRADIYKLFTQMVVTDDNLIESLFIIYNTLIRSILNLNNLRKEKHQQYLQNRDIELYSDEEKLFLTTEEVVNRREKVKNIWSRMLDPNYQNGE